MNNHLYEYPKLTLNELKEVFWNTLAAFHSAPPSIDQVTSQLDKLVKAAEHRTFKVTMSS